MSLIRTKKAFIGIFKDSLLPASSGYYSTHCSGHCKIYYLQLHQNGFCYERLINFPKLILVALDRLFQNEIKFIGKGREIRFEDYLKITAKINYTQKNVYISHSHYSLDNTTTKGHVDFLYISISIFSIFLYLSLIL